MTDEDIEGISTKSLGIGGAESVGNMSLTPSNKPAVEETPRVSQAPWLLEGLGRLAAGEELSGAKAGAVERSQAEVFVERVERAVETLQTRPERVVHLHLGEGSEEKLSVRLQLRDGMIHTTFVTASEEMRSTLSREWGHSLAASLGSDSSLRVAEPVFSSHERGENSGGNSGAQADAQKQQQQAQENSSAARGNAQYAGHSRSSKQADAHPAVGSGETVHDETSSRLLHAMA